MSNASSNWLELPLTPPRWLLPAVLALAILAMLAIWTSAAPRWLLAFPMIAVGLTLFRLHRAPRGVLRFRDDGEVLWMDRESRERPLRLQGIGSRGPLRVLRFDADEGRFSAIYCRPGNLDAAQDRRLTLWLRRSGNSAAQVGNPALTP